MFKCCRCTSSRGSHSNTDSDSNDTPTASRKVVDPKEDGEMETSPKAVEANGVVPRAEETEETKETPVESTQPATEREGERSIGDGAEGKPDLDSTKGAESAINQADVNTAGEEKPGSTGEEEADKRDVAKKPEAVNEDSLSSTPATTEQMAEKVADVCLDNEESVDDEAELNSPPAGDQAQSDAIAVKIPVCSTKTNLYCSSGYIERTIDDGPDDEGDDSVFEACPGENEAADKAQSGTAPADIGVVDAQPAYYVRADN